MEKDYKRLMQFVLGKEDCWEWQGTLDKDGYGWFTQKGKLYRAHRASYRLLIGKIDERPIDHLCRNRKCVNPNHMELVSQRVNTLRSPIAPAAINSLKTHCYKGHEFVGDNLYIVGTTGERRCKTCTYANKKARRVKAKAERIARGEHIGQRVQTHCKRGHEYTYTKAGKHCRECSRLKTQKFRQLHSH